MAVRFETVDDYVAAQPEDVQVILETIRKRLRRLMPGSEEVISYQIPTIKVDGKYVVYFGAWKSHISLYPVGALEEPLESEVASYRSGKDTVRFPLDKPIPYALIDKLVSVMVGRRLGGKR